MRLMIDALVAVMLAMLIAGVLWHHRAQSAHQADIEEARTSVHQIAREIALRVALHQAAGNESSPSLTIDTAWFQPHLPENPLVDEGHPWLELAGLDERLLRHPRERIASDKALAKFWYNPSNGIVRARVAPHGSDQTALELYNQINECQLNSIFADARDE
jgi:hypothetical protein